MSNFIVDIIIYWHFVSKSVIYRNNNGRPCATERVNESGVWSPGADSSPEPISTTFSSGTDKLATARRLQSALPIVVSSRRVAQTTADWLLRRRTAHRTEMRHFSLSIVTVGQHFGGLAKLTGLVESHFAYRPSLDCSCSFSCITIIKPIYDTRGHISNCCMCH